jgi:HEAT repeat protein
MSESNPNPPNGPLYAPETGFSLFIKLFIIPAVIVLVALGIFFLGTMALQHPKTAEQYLEELKSDNTSRRWQSAYELSRMLNQNENIQFDQTLREQLVQVFAGAKNDDPRLRQYLALILGRLKEKSAVPVLSDAIHDENEDVKIYSLWALGNIEDPKGGEAALTALSDPDAKVQVMAVGALSSLRYEPAKFPLEKNLESADRDLRYDSAVALARLKDPKAVPVLLEMLNLKAADNLKPAEKSQEEQFIQSAKITAIDGFQELPDPALKVKVVDLAKNASDIKVQEAALAALKK